MEWDAPESALAAEGVQAGTMTVKHVDGCFYEGELEREGAGRRVQDEDSESCTIPLAKYLTWIETDSRGYSLFKPGTIGADSGGYFTHYFETQGFKVGGKSHSPQGQHVSRVAVEFPRSVARFRPTASPT